MPSTATTRNRLEKQAAGENSNTWGTKVNTVFDIIDSALSGVTTVSTYPITLSNADYTDDQAKKRVLNCTGAGGTIVIPNAEKVYLVRNASSGSVTITTGSGTTASVTSGVVTWVFCDGANNVYSQTGGTIAGTYTPTASNITNVSSNTISALYYESTGTKVDVWGKIVLSPSGSTTFSIDLSLPVASTFTSDNQAAGRGTNEVFVNTFFNIKSVSGGGLRLTGFVTQTAPITFYFDARYRVL